MSKPMTKAAAARIQSAAAKQNSGKVAKGSFAAKAMSAADSNTSNNNPNWPSKNEDMPSGGGRGNNPPRK